MERSEWKWGEGPAEVLLLHGFSGGPSDLRYLGDHLYAAGFSCLAPALPGHGPDASRLAEVEARDWQEAAARTLRTHREARGGPLIVVGFSLGGALASYLAANQAEDVRALILLAPALRLKGSSHLYRVLFRLPLASKLVGRVKKGPPDIAPGSLPIERGPSRLPTRAAALLLDRMIEEARGAVERVKCPALVFWGAEDRVVPREAAEEASNRIGAPLVVLPNSAHHLALGPERERLGDEVLAFLRRLDEAMPARAEA